MSALLAAAGAGPLAAAWCSHAWWMHCRLEKARRDPLTGLHTRDVFEKAASRLLRSGPCVVAVLDLDGFKQINDRFGHAAGDAVICQSAVRLRGWRDHFECSGAAVARLGGDEFALAVRDASNASGSMWWLHKRLTAPLDHEGHRIAVGASIGAYVTGGDGDLPSALRRADEAMYTAKLDGGGVFLADLSVPSYGSTNGRRSGRDGTTDPRLGGAR